MQLINDIPALTDPLGRYWEQPADVRSAEIDAKNVLLTALQLTQLREYSSSIPSGVYPGKCWLRRERGRDLLAWYGPEINGKCSIEFREVLRLDDAPSAALGEDEDER